MAQLTKLKKNQRTRSLWSCWPNWTCYGPLNDIQLRSGDVVTIPKEPSFLLTDRFTGRRRCRIRPVVMHRGTYNMQVHEGFANKKNVFVIQADGTVIGHETSLTHSSDIRTVRTA
jgi:hypothetical protein